MDDEKIVGLYWDRNEQAIAVSSEKYGRYCTHIAHNILFSQRDEEECVNDTWLNAWNSMPPHRPSLLSVFFGKITRNLAIDRYRNLHREKRGGDSIDAVLDELAEIVSGNEDPEGAVLENELKKEINAFLKSQPAEKRFMFIRRYWYADTIAEIAERFKVSENNVSVTLNRLRKSLGEHLQGKGYGI